MHPTRLLLVASLAAATLPTATQSATFHTWAERPTLGWNSWDFYGTSINEERTKAQADYMAATLLPHGWNLITVDIQWYEPNATGFTYNAAATLTMDEWGRLTPATNRFPSAAGGVGFKALADYVHAKGLRFGIHMMRGIPRQAWQADLPVKGTTFSARDIADTNSICSWNPDMYGVDMNKPGAQAYYDSVLELVASWGVDFIKVDDLSRPYHAKEIEAIRRAIDKTGRPIVFSTSPGDTPVSQGAHVASNANQWRVSDDFWDVWSTLLGQFQRLHAWTPYRGPGHFPDADMLPLGKISGGSPTSTGRTTNFTANEQVTLMTLWSIARSPLIHGGDMTQMDPATLALLTNDEVLAVNQNSTHNRQLSRSGDQIVWVADAASVGSKHLAVFNTGAASAPIAVPLASLGASGAVQVRDLWQRSDLGSFTGTFTPTILSHGAALYTLTGTFVPTPWLSAATAGNAQVSLAWESLAGASAYRLKRATTETSAYTVVADNLTSTSYTDTNVSNGTTYFYVVSAIVGGQETPDSGAISALPAGTPQVVSWNFDRFGTLAPANTAGVVPRANWNNSWPSDPRTDLVDSTGAPTTLDLSYSSYNSWSIQGTSPALDADGSGNKRLLNGYLNSGPAAWGPWTTRSSITLTEIPHGFYDLIVYFSSDQANREGLVTDGRSTYYFKTVGAPSISGTNAVLTQTTQSTTAVYPNANYAVFGGLAGATQTISVEMRDNDEWGGIAGFQVVPKADPLPEIHPVLAPNPSGGGTVLSWDPALGQVILEESTDLATWQLSDTQPTGASVVVTPATFPRFYRLSRP